MVKHPLADRETRIQRREERNLFKRRLLPLAWVLGALGLLGLLASGLHLLIYDEWPYQVSGLFVALTSLPFVLIVIGFFRGHYSDRLHEP